MLLIMLVLTLNILLVSMFVTLLVLNVGISFSNNVSVGRGLGLGFRRFLRGITTLRILHPTPPPLFCYPSLFDAAREQLGGNKFLVSDGMFVAKALNRTFVEYPVKDARCGNSGVYGFCRCN